METSAIYLIFTDFFIHFKVYLKFAQKSFFKYTFYFLLTKLYLQALHTLRNF